MLFLSSLSRFFSSLKSLRSNLRRVLSLNSPPNLPLISLSFRSCVAPNFLFLKSSCSLFCNSSKIAFCVASGSAKISSKIAPNFACNSSRNSAVFASKRVTITGVVLLARTNAQPPSKCTLTPSISIISLIFGSAFSRRFKRFFKISTTRNLSSSLVCTLISSVLKTRGKRSNSASKSTPFCTSSSRRNIA